jgi:hypothetical protein
MTTAASEVLWEAVSGLVAAGALTLSIVVLITQRSRDRRQELIQERLSEIEDARRHDEVRSRDQAQDRALIADVRVCEFRMESPGGAGQSDMVSITIENRGPALARRLDLALWKTRSEHRATISGASSSGYGKRTRVTMKR